MYSLIYLYQYGHMVIYFLSVKPNTTLFCCLNCSSLGHWEHFHLAPVFFSQTHVNGVQFFILLLFFVLLLFFCTSLVPNTPRCSLLILYNSSAVLESTICPRKLDFFYQKWHQKPRSGHQIYSLLLGYCFFEPFWLTEQKIYTCKSEHMYTHTDMSIHISICNHMNLCQAKHEYLLMSPILIWYQMNHSSLLSTLTPLHLNPSITGRNLSPTSCHPLTYPFSSIIHVQLHQDH